MLQQLLQTLCTIQTDASSTKDAAMLQQLLQTQYTIQTDAARHIDLSGDLKLRPVTDKVNLTQQPLDSFLELYSISIPF